MPDSPRMNNTQQTRSSLQAALEHEQELRIKAEEEANMLLLQVQRQQHDVERYRRGHAHILNDLNRFKASQSVRQVPDDFLTFKVMELRQEVRDFSIQYFQGELDASASRACRSPETLMASLGPMDPRESFLLSPTRAASAAEAFVWAFLAKYVFGGWWWAGSGHAKLLEVCRWMKRADSFAVLGAPKPSDIEAERRFYAWRAATAQLVAAMPPSPAALDVGRSRMVEEICRVICPYLRTLGSGSSGSSSGGGCGGESPAEDLSRIVDKAVEFDRETSQQAAHLEWVFCWPPGTDASTDADANTSPNACPQAFDPAVMALRPCESLSRSDESGHAVLLVVAPGLRKRGRSTGEDFATETMLLKMEVTCEPVADAIYG